MPVLSLNCWSWLKYFSVFAVMNQIRTFVQQGTWWSPKRPPGEESGDSKLIYALLFEPFPHKDCGRKKHTFSKGKYCCTL